MTVWLSWVISASVLILLVAVIRRLLRGRISLRLQYALWGLVLLRLLLPVSVGDSAASVLNAVPEPRAATVSTAVHTAVPTETEAPTPTDPPAGAGGASPAEPTADQPAAPLSQPAAASASSSPPGIATLLLLLWALGAAAVAGCLLAANLRFSRRLKRCRRPMAANCPLPVYETAAVDTPCLFGLFRPAVYVTAAAAADENVLRHVLAHELTHYRHGDHVWSLLRGACLALHWFNPLVWWAASLSKYDAELACDEGAIKRLGESQRADYGRTLISLTCAGSGPRELLLTATTMTFSPRNIKERVTLIARRPQMAAYTVVTVTLVAAMALICTFTGPKQLSAPLMEEALMPQQGEVIATIDGTPYAYDPAYLFDLTGGVFLPQPDGYYQGLALLLELCCYAGAETGVSSEELLTAQGAAARELAAERLAAARNINANPHLVDDVEQAYVRDQLSRSEYLQLLSVAAPAQRWREVIDGHISDNGGAENYPARARPFVEKGLYVSAYMRQRLQEEGLLHDIPVGQELSGRGLDEFYRTELIALCARYNVTIVSEALADYLAKEPGHVTVDVSGITGVPAAVIAYATDYVEREIENWNYQAGSNHAIGAARIVGLTEMDDDGAASEPGQSLWRLAYRLLPKDSENVVWPEGRRTEVIDGQTWLTEADENGQPWLALRHTCDESSETTRWQRLGVVTTAQLEETYGSPEMLAQYGSRYTAAATELARLRPDNHHPTPDDALTALFDAGNGMVVTAYDSQGRAGNTYWLKQRSFAERMAFPLGAYYDWAELDHPPAVQGRERLTMESADGTKSLTIRADGAVGVFDEATGSAVYWHGASLYNGDSAFSALRALYDGYDLEYMHLRKEKTAIEVREWAGLTARFGALWEYWRYRLTAAG